MKKRTIVKLLLMLVVICLLAATKSVWLPIPGEFLIVKDEIGKADCIVPLNSDAYFRFKKAAELYKQGYSKKIVISPIPERETKFEDYGFRIRLLAGKDIPEKEFLERAFAYFGVDSNDILITGREVTSTYEEAVAAKRFMLDKGFKSMILVTSTYHSRRALMIFRTVFRGTGIRIYHVSVESELYNPRRWWCKERDMKTVAQEYASFIYNIFYHFILKKSRTSFDSV